MTNLKIWKPVPRQNAECITEWQRFTIIYKMYILPTMSLLLGIVSIRDDAEADL